jgi:hypothetical protein
LLEGVEDDGVLPSLDVVDDEVPPPFEAVPDVVCAAAGVGMSPPTGAVPGADCVLGVVDEVLLPLEVVSGAVCAGAAGELLPREGAPGAGCTVGVLAGVVLEPVDCAQSPVAIASAKTAGASVLAPSKFVLMTSPPALMLPGPSAASLYLLDASIRPFGIRSKEYLLKLAVPTHRVFLGGCIRLILLWRAGGIGEEPCAEQSR